MWKKLLGQAVDFTKDKVSDAVDKAKDTAEDIFSYDPFRYKDYAESDAVKNAGAALNVHKGTKPDDFTYEDYVESDAVKNAGAALNVHKETKPEEFTYGDYVESDAVKNAGAALDAHKETKPGEFTYGDYAESETVRQAKAALDAQLSAKPGEYSSKWQEQIEDMLARIAGREDFSYDVNADALYQQYKDQYMQAGRMAMADTMGQAAAMTGGYGNSYAASAGNQAYQGYLSQLTAMIPELEGRAYDRYLREGQEMQDLYAMYRDREDQDYGRYRDSVADFERERDYLTGRYDAERNLDYGKYVDDRNYAYGQHRDDVGDYYTELDYLTGRYDTERNLDYGKYVDDRNYAYGQHRDDMGDYYTELDYLTGRYDTESEKDYGRYMDGYNRAYGEYADGLNLAYTDYRNQIEDKQWRETFEYGQDRDIVDDNKWQAEMDLYEGAKESGDEATALQHVATLSSEDLVSIVQSYGVERDFDGMEAFLLDCVVSGRITEEQMLDFIDRFWIPDTGNGSSGISKGPSNSSGAVNFG